MSRINILSRHDIINYESVPKINEIEWGKVIEKVQAHDGYSQSLRINTTKIVYIVQYGYFLHAQRFFPLNDFSEVDIKFVSKSLNIKYSSIITDLDDKAYFWKFNKEILKSLDYKPYKSNKDKVTEEISFYINKQFKPKKIFEQVILSLKHNRIELPSYDRLQKDITNGLNEFEEQLLNQIKLHLGTDMRGLLDGLLEEIIKEDQNFALGIKTSVLTQLKAPNQSIKPSKILESIADFKMVARIFDSLFPIMEKLNFSAEVISYHASWTIKARLFQIQQFASPEKRHLYLLSFINHQYKLRQDNFVDVFLSSVKNYQNFIEKKKKEAALVSMIEKDTVKKINSSRNHYRTFCDNIIRIIDGALDIESKMESIGQLVEDEKSYREKKEARLDGIYEEVESKPSNEELYYSLLQKHHRKLLSKVGGVIGELEFIPATSEPNIIEVVDYYKRNNGDISKLNDLSFLEDKEFKHVIDAKGNIRGSLCKVLLMFKIEHALKSGALNLKHSYKYQSFENYLFGKGEWESNKKLLLSKAGMVHLADPSYKLDILEQELNNAYHTTNTKYNAGCNPYLKLNKVSRPIVSTPSGDNNNPKEFILSDFLPSERFFSLQQILHQVNDSVNFLDCFEHFSIKHQKRRPSSNTLLAIVMGLGCNIGLKKISRISKGISAGTLENIKTWYFTQENLDSANAQLISVINQLSFAKLYLTKEGEVHTSSDGQKFAVKPESLNSNYSFKYFGKERGVSVYTFLDQRSSIFFTNVISSSIRESTYVPDGLCFNSDLVSTMHSTDTHGYTEVVFGMLDLLDINFAPRIKNIGNQALYSFKRKNHYEDQGYKILPAKYINAGLIKEYWDDILRVMVSIKLQNCKASQILKRLNSYSKQNPVHKALKEYGRINKSIFILNYLDDLELRRMIDKQLNLIELAHRFARFVLFDNNQEYDEPTKEGQEVIAGCKQLIQNCIILWNYMKLTQIYDRSKSLEEKQKLTEAAKQSSIICWGHVNLNGEYDFTKDHDKGENFNLEKLKNVTIKNIDNTLY